MQANTAPSRRAESALLTSAKRKKVAIMRSRNTTGRACRERSKPIVRGLSRSRARKPPAFGTRARRKTSLMAAKPIGRIAVRSSLSFLRRRGPRRVTGKSSHGAGWRIYWLNVHVSRELRVLLDELKAQLGLFSHQPF